MSERPLLPPRLKDWKKGTHQVGLFVRGPSGCVVEATFENVDEKTALQIVEIMVTLANRKKDA